MSQKNKESSPSCLADFGENWQKIQVFVRYREICYNAVFAGENTMSRLLKIMLSGLVMAVLLSACENTVHGFGKDMEKTGENIQDSKAAQK